MSDDDRVFIGDQANRDQTQTINKFDEIIALLRDINMDGKLIKALLKQIKENTTRYDLLKGEKESPRGLKKD